MVRSIFLSSASTSALLTSNLMAREAALDAFLMAFLRILSASIRDITPEVEAPSTKGTSTVLVIYLEEVW